MKKKSLVSVALASLLFGVSSFGANSMNQVVGSSNKKNAINKEVAFQNKKFKMASEDIQKGLNDTLKAIDALQKKDTKNAKKYLSDASKYFDKALKSNPHLRLVPIENDIVAYRFGGGPKTIKASVDLAKKMLESNQVQVARELLDPLRDEIDITTHYIPMDLYPNATKIAAKLLEQGKTKEALQELVLGLSTIVGDEVIIPIPLLTAQDLVITASKLDKKKKKDALALLDQAKIELQKALLLGYTTKYSAEYKNLTKLINGIEKEIKGKNRVEKLYENLKEKFKELIGLTRKERKDISSLKNATNKSSQSAVKEENKNIAHISK
jgi:hypothetical protein